ncbi:hypothetical protein D3H55_13925 [Bacillus salacetis]|uniref:DUF3899 domain-containing protein n=1 Tax=Bacillus salacetis TaxID=2315464 RepID=A0A3A1QYM8_9BACI|nr:hypothetical protein [Bacillus salacetis]RIW31978.1 hypothetical protein D3H55_13925 [Bacillus salacetis]
MFILKMASTSLFVIAVITIAIVQDKVLTYIETKFSRTFAYLLVVSVFLMIQWGIVLLISSNGTWSLLDTSFICAPIFFGIGWITSFTRRASINQAGASLRFLTNGSYQHDYSVEQVKVFTPFFAATLTFFIISWGISFYIAFTY